MFIHKFTFRVLFVLGAVAVLGPFALADIPEDLKEGEALLQTGQHREIGKGDLSISPYIVPDRQVVLDVNWDRGLVAFKLVYHLASENLEPGEEPPLPDCEYAGMSALPNSGVVLAAWDLKQSTWAQIFTVYAAPRVLSDCNNADADGVLAEAKKWFKSQDLDLALMPEPQLIVKKDTSDTSLSTVAVSTPGGTRSLFIVDRSWTKEDANSSKAQMLGLGELGHAGGINQHSYGSIAHLQNFRNIYSGYRHFLAAMAGGGFTQTLSGWQQGNQVFFLEKHLKTSAMGGIPNEVHFSFSPLLTMEEEAFAPHFPYSSCGLMRGTIGVPETVELTALPYGRGKVLGTLTRGDPVDVVASYAGWALVRVSPEVLESVPEAWVPTRAITAQLGIRKQNVSALSLTFQMDGMEEEVSLEGYDACYPRNFDGGECLQFLSCDYGRFEADFQMPGGESRRVYLDYPDYTSTILLPDPPPPEKAEKQGTHCENNESVYFSCALESQEETGSPRYLSLCGSPNLEAPTASGIPGPYLQYHFGPLRAPELVFPEKRKGSLDEFYFESLSFVRSFGKSVSFFSGGHRYIVQRRVGSGHAGEGESNNFNGVRVWRGSKPVAEFSCKAERQNNLGALKGFLKEEAH